MDRNSRTQLARQLGPFAVTTLAAWGAVLIGAHTDWAQYGVSVGLLALSWSYGLWAGLRGHLRSGTVIGSLGFLAALALVRNAAGGSTAGISIVSLLPVFQTALFVRDRRALWIVLAAVLGFYLAPLVIVGAPQYPTSGYRSALLAVAVSSIVGLVTHGLVADIRRRAREARHRERMLVRINETVQELFESPNPRRDACGAVKEISDAIVALLFEPERGWQTLTLSATTMKGDRSKTPAAYHSAVQNAFRSRQPILITQDIENHLADVELWRASGAPASVLYQPLLKGDVPVGVLVVGWSDIAQRDEPRVVAASLLAHEIASVIDRADMIGQLTDEALTDALTGLPNRRAWDTESARALQGHGPVAVAMLDIDHFKRFNDTNGHPAGDRLLREAASRWRAEMRAGDFLARLGGEEFGLLVTGADVTTIQTIVARLCARMPAQQTCSAGIALRSAGDTPEQLVARADAALYEAKTAGRNRVIFTDARHRERSA
jgi:diguanylate cyclase (GGDEF)-like protein